MLNNIYDKLIEIKIQATKNIHIRKEIFDGISKIKK